jgi:hypothetical protein
VFSGSKDDQMPRKNEDQRKIITVKLLAAIQNGTGKTAIELEKIFFAGQEISPAGSRWNRLARGDRGLSAEKLQEMTKWAKRRGLLPKESLKTTNWESIEKVNEVKEALFLTRQKNQAAMKIVANARSKLRAAIDMIEQYSDQVISVEDKYWSKGKDDEGVELDVFDGWLMLDDLKQAENNLKGIRFRIDPWITHEAELCGINGNEVKKLSTKKSEK